MRRYMQSHAVEDPLYDGLRTARTGMHAPFDGIASVWFDSREDLIAATTSSEGRKAGALLLEDERRFIDLSRSPLWVSQEVVQINPMPENSIVAWPKSSWIKFCYLLQPKEGMSQAACHKTWNMEHGYLIRRHSGAHPLRALHPEPHPRGRAERPAPGVARWATALRRADRSLVRSLRPRENPR
jgi:EthD domain